MAKDWFNNPTKRIAWIFTLLFGIGIICLTLASTNFFTEKFDPSLIMGGSMVGAGWAVARIWANYHKHQGGDDLN